VRESKGESERNAHDLCVCVLCVLGVCVCVCFIVAVCVLHRTSGAAPVLRISVRERG